MKKSVLYATGLMFSLSVGISSCIAVRASPLTCRDLVLSYLEADQEPQKIPEMCAEIGRAYGICPELLEAIIERESGGDPKAVNGDCRGLCQIADKWHKDRMKRLGVTDIYDPYGNISVCADYLVDLIEEGIQTGRGDDLAYALMRYSMKTETANRLWDSGKSSQYAIEVMERAAELERERGK